MCAALDYLGLPSYYVPAGLGGALHSYEDLLSGCAAWLAGT